MFCVVDSFVEAGKASIFSGYTSSPLQKTWRANCVYDNPSIFRRKEKPLLCQLCSTLWRNRFSTKWKQREYCDHYAEHCNFPLKDESQSKKCSSEGDLLRRKAWLWRQSRVENKIETHPSIIHFWSYSLYIRNIELFNRWSCSSLTVCRRCSPTAVVQLAAQLFEAFLPHESSLEQDQHKLSSNTRPWRVCSITA